MSPSLRLAVVTATLQPETAVPCMQSWQQGTGPIDFYVVDQAQPVEHGWARLDTDPEGRTLTRMSTTAILGTVPAFARGVAKALEDGADVIACLHDDLEIAYADWDRAVLDWFRHLPQMGLCGFGGALGLGAGDLYRTPYHPMQLARQDFVSNMRDAEAHGRRTLSPVRVACLDGFSQIGRRAFWEGKVNPAAHITTPPSYQAEQLFEIMRSWGVVHHFYDGMLGCFARRLGWEVWMLPIACHHYGGRTAVGDARYAEWAKTIYTTGDQGVWEFAHRVGYDEFRDVLPIRT